MRVIPVKAGIHVKDSEKVGSLPQQGMTTDNIGSQVASIRPPRGGVAVSVNIISWIFLPLWVMTLIICMFQV